MWRLQNQLYLITPENDQVRLCASTAGNPLEHLQKWKHDDKGCCLILFSPDPYVAFYCLTSKIHVGLMSALKASSIQIGSPICCLQNTAISRAHVLVSCPTLRHHSSISRRLWRGELSTFLFSAGVEKNLEWILYEFLDHQKCFIKSTQVLWALWGWLILILACVLCLL